MMSRVWRLAAALGVVVALAVAVAVARQEEPFLHEEHEGLFPVCAGCHQGIDGEDLGAFYPEPELCVQCHDGQQEERVSWTGPAESTSNVSFTHSEHIAELERARDAPLACETCHSDPAGDRMSVDAAEELESCWSCHAHETESHYESGTCETCHVTLSETDFDVARIQALPTPEDHESGLFLAEEHGLASANESARCATCHTSDRCLACHVVGDRAEIDAIPAAPADMELPPAVAAYPEPESHVDEGWFDEHGGETPVGECSTCHTTDDCRTCHVSPVPDLVEALPARADVDAPGVGLTPRAPETHESLFFMNAHSALAAVDEQSCATCHTESSCLECHDAPASGGYHPPDFVARHSADAFGQATECANCHETAVFCRSCHIESGLGSEGRLGGGYHDAEPLWLLRHGTAARQSLESCASCHEQNQCLQCHAVRGAFKVSPHTRDFDAEAAWERNPRTCFACHVKNPIGDDP